jgi:hypothetical protein
MGRDPSAANWYTFVNDCGMDQLHLVAQRNCLMDISGLSPSALLALHAHVADELRSRGITRSSNNHTGDLAEYLFCKASGWTQSGNSNRSIDAVDSGGISYQVKGRRITRFNNSRQLSAIRNLARAHFDFLAGVLFNEDYTVMRAFQCVLHIQSPGEVVTLKYRLRAKYPIRARTFKSEVYEYYDPEIASDARPVQLEVRKR